MAEEYTVTVKQGKADLTSDRKLSESEPKASPAIVYLKTDTTAMGYIVSNKTTPVLHASNLRIKTLSDRPGQARETTNVTKVEALRIMFDIEEREIAESNDKQLYIRVVAPDGNVLNDRTDKSDTLIDRSGEAVTYSAKKELILTPNETVKEVSVDIGNDGDCEKGDYNIEIYNDGYRVGGGSISLQ